MQTDTAVSAEELVSRLRPALTQGNLREAQQCIRQTWTPAQLTVLVKNESADARKVAALALGMVGDATAVRPLAVALHDSDAMVAQMAEHALWSIWFRLGQPTAVSLVKSASNHLQHGNYDSAIEKCTQAIQEDPNFAEAYHQRAIANYLAERYEEAIADCKATLTRMPQHFGAMSSMGHCYAHLGQWRQARHCYRLALAIHPRIEGIEASLRQIEQLLQEHPELP